MISRNLLIGSVACASLLAGCGDDVLPADQTGAATGIRINVDDFTFSPASIAVEPGAETTVIVTNGDPTDHSFTIDDLGVDLVVGNDEEDSVTFTAPTTGATFRCKFHDNMVGTITVGAGSPPPATTPPATGSGQDPSYDY